MSMRAMSERPDGHCAFSTWSAGMILAALVMALIWVLVERWVRFVGGGYFRRGGSG